MQEVYIMSAVRTPIGSFGGVLSPLTATQLGSLAVTGALTRAGVPPNAVQELFMGNVVSANLGQAPARQVALAAGLPDTVPCTTVNKVCASGTKAIMLAAQAIMCGQAEVVVAGGMESMSNIPYYVPRARYGYHYGHGELLDGLVRDGLEDVYQQQAMGVFADATARRYELSRAAQDEYAARSYRLAAQATDANWFKDEIVPVDVPQRKGAPLRVDQDEEYRSVQFEKIPTLRPAFTKDGTVTAANASTINDGAAALVLMSRPRAEALGLTPLARIRSFADAAHAPEWFTTAPTRAVPLALQRAGLTTAEVDFFEINEAFAVVPMVFNRLLEVPEAKTNVFGGAVALGHPLGCSGARIVATLLNVLRHQGGTIGVAGICNGGGGASALVVERL